MTVARTEGVAPRPHVAVLRRVWLAVLAVAFVAAAVRGYIALRIPVPWIMTDELIYRDMATSFARSGQLLVRGESIGLVSLYPIVLAPFWRAGSVALSFDLSKILNVIAMTASSLLVFAWARRLVSPLYAGIAFALSLLIPAFLYTSELMSENLAMPVFVLAAFAIWHALQRPTLARQAGAVAAIALSCAIRTEGVVLVAIWATAIAVSAVLSVDGPRRGREVLRAFRPYWPSAAAVAALGAIYVLVTALRGRHLLGFYEAAADSPYSVVRLLQWFVYHLAELSIAVGLIPAAALLLLLGGAARRRVAPPVAALLAVTVSSVVWLVAVAGTWASWHGDGIRERYDMYAVPLVLIVFAVFLAREAPARRYVLAAAAVACLAPLALPLAGLLRYGVESKAPSLNGFLWVGGVDGHLARAVLAAFAVVATAALLLRGRPRLVACAGFVAIAFALTTLAGLRLTKNLADLINVNSRASSWVDERVGGDADVGLVWTGEIDPNWIWQTEFWNRSVRRVYYLRERDPGILPTEKLVVDPRSAELRADGQPLPVTALVSDRSFTTNGRRLASLVNGFRLTKASPRTKVDAIRTGVFTDGWTGGTMTYTRPGCRGMTRLGFLFRNSSASPPQQVTARQAGVVVARARSVPGKPVVLNVPLDAARDCTLSLQIVPTWSPAAVFGSSDTRRLGLLFDSVRRLG